MPIDELPPARHLAKRTNAVRLDGKRLYVTRCQSSRHLARYMGIKTGLPYYASAYCGPYREGKYTGLTRSDGRKLLVFAAPCCAAAGSGSGSKAGSISGSVSGSISGSVSGSISGPVGSASGSVGSRPGSVGSAGGSIGSIVPGSVSGPSGSGGSVSPGCCVEANGVEIAYAITWANGDTASGSVASVLSVWQDSGTTTNGHAYTFSMGCERDLSTGKFLWNPTVDSAVDGSFNGTATYDPGSDTFTYDDGIGDIVTFSNPNCTHSLPVQ